MDVEILYRRLEQTGHGLLPLWLRRRMREHGADAEIVAARRADEMLERGDHEGQVV